MILAVSAGIYFVLGSWASGQLYDKGYPAWAGWVIALTGIIPTLILVNVLPSKRAERDRMLTLTTEMELARQNAGIPMGGYGHQAPPVWAPDSSQPSLTGGAQAPANGFSQPAYQQPVYQRAPVGAGFVSPQWVPPESQDAAPTGARRCGGCEFLVAPGRSTCPNCGLPIA
ncbi:MAG: hypothetical protein DCC49_10050 [Acidobacteria bacterium]|nr:MAG: hypothetical protein DCC49_10050 [Acidobacteriota bacterium]